jgi:hypothetical protein
VVIVTPGEPDVLLVGFYNHVPNAERIAAECDVRWVGERPLETALAAVRERTWERSLQRLADGYRRTLDPAGVSEGVSRAA